jgi:hypothetical protein
MHKKVISLFKLCNFLSGGEGEEILSGSVIILWKAVFALAKHMGMSFRVGSPKGERGRIDLT